MENQQFLILEEIYLRYSSRTGTSLNDLIKRKFSKADSDLQQTIDIKTDLENLEERGILTWKAEPMDKKGGNFPESHIYRSLLGKEKGVSKYTFQNIYVEVQLTKEVGLDYAGNIVNRVATLLTNKSMKTLTIVLVIIGVITIFLQGLQCDISRRQLEQSQPTTKSSTTDSKDTSHATVYSACDSLKQKNGDSNKTNHTDTTTPKHNLFNNSHKPK